MSSVRESRTPIVMLLTGVPTPAVTAVERALSCARALGGEVRVAVVLSREPDADDPAGALERIVDPLVRVGIASANITLHTGHVGEVAAEIAEGSPVELIVMSPELGGGGLAGEVADELQVPVLVARVPLTGGAIIAATDLTPASRPVLATSRAFARALNKGLTVFHNAPPSFSFTLGAMASSSRWEPSTTPSRTVRNRREDILVGRSERTVDAILDALLACDGDLVTVGHSRHPWFERLFASDLAERLVARCPRSVLVVPVRES